MTPRSFCLVQRKIRPSNYLISFLSMSLRRKNSTADGQSYRLAIYAKRGFSNTSPQSRCNIQGLMRSGFWQQHYELFSAKSRDNFISSKKFID
jgi:hypothetical protein